MRPIDFEADSATPTQIAEHLERCDDAFVPPLSTRTGIDDYARKIGRQAVRFEAWVDRTLVGLVAAYFNDEDRRVVFITDVSVEAAFQRTGIASELIRRCIERATNEGFDAIELEVDRANAPAIGLYSRLGFVASDMPGDSIRMRLDTAREQV